MERFGDPLDVQQSDIALPALHAAEVCAVEIALSYELLLRQPDA